MQPSGIMITQRNWTTQAQGPWLARFVGKLMLDILPAALASVIGGFLFTQYHFAQSAPPPLVAVQPASPEMMAMIRDEHAEIMSYLKAQMTAEKNRDLAEDAASARAASDARAAADARLAEALSASHQAARQSAAVVVAAKTAPARPKPIAVAAAVPRAPLVIAQAQPSAAFADPDPDGVAPGARLARDPDSLLAKTLDIKDHVVAATRHVVSMIGGMFASVGDSISGTVSSTRQFDTPS